jgi:hypothetical protein
MQLRMFIDGPRGFLAEALRAAKVTLPAELAESFSYLAHVAKSNKASVSTRRSRKSAGGSVLSGSSSLSCGSKVEHEALDEAQTEDT